MPELPDVEGHRRLVERQAAGRQVRRVRVPDRELLHGTTPAGLGRSLVGRRVGQPQRHGKWLLVPFDGPWLLVHFRMTGELAWTTEDDPYDVAVLHLEGGDLRYRSRRRLGGIHYARAGTDPAEVTGPLGPDARTLGRVELHELLGGRRGMLKSALMDQEFVAGLGNELVDEILWRARLHPRTGAGELDRSTSDRLHQVMRDVLRQSVRAGHVPSGPNWLNAQRDREEPSCPRCGATLERAQVGGRTTLWCPQDQPG